MIELSRTVRFCISFDDSNLDSMASPRTNTHGAWPPPVGLAAYYELEVMCRGRADPVTGYLHSIADVDRAVREHILPDLEQSARRTPGREPATFLPAMFDLLRTPLRGTVSAITWHLTPYHAVTMEADTMNRVTLIEEYSFAAAHRLHSPELSAEENRRIFGKCNNVNGHGHNYRVQVAVDVDLGPNGLTVPRERIRALVDELVINRFDHTHLNQDTEEFRERMPSVEEIARVCHDLLAPAVAGAGAALRSVQVWETSKTSCRYPAEPVPG